MAGVGFRFGWWRDAVLGVLLLWAVVTLAGAFTGGYTVAQHAEMAVIAAVHIFPVYWLLGRLGRRLPFPLPARFADYWNPVAVVILALLVRSDPCLKGASHAPRGGAADG
jgi:hypothetical protein